MMLAKKKRTPIHQFPKTSSTMFRGRFIVVKKSYNNLSWDRVGVLVGRGVAKGAVHRNKIKRTVLRAVHPQKNKNKNTDYLVIVKSVPTDKLETLKLEVKKAFR